MNWNKIVMVGLLACLPLQATTTHQEQAPKEECKKSKTRVAADAALFLIGISGLCGWGYTLYWWKNNGLAGAKSNEQTESVPLTNEQFIAQQVKLDAYNNLTFSNHDIIEIIDLAGQASLPQQVAIMKSIKVKDIEHKKKAIAMGAIALALAQWQRNTAQQS